MAPRDPQRPSSQIERDIEFHIEMRAREFADGGLDPREARRRAEALFVGRDRVERACASIVRRRDRRARWRRWWANAGADAAFALRRLRRRPRVAAIAVLTMALGIGAATAIFSIVDGVLLRPLPFDDPGRLVSVWLTDDRWRTESALANGWNRIPIGRAEYDPLRSDAASLAEVGLWAPGTALLDRRAQAGSSGGGDDDLLRVATVRVTASLLSMLHVAPARGRIFAAGEDVLNGPKVALLGWETWQTRFGAAESAVGTTILLDEVPYTIVGVLPAGVRLSRSAPPPAVWIPALQQESDLPAMRNRSYRALGRLAATATPSRATDEAARVFRSTPDGSDHIGARVEQWQDDDAINVRGTLLMLVGAVGLLMAIACVNVSMVTLAEATTRARELATRVAMGASMARLVRQFLTESLVIAAGGAAAGTLLAGALIAVVIDIAPRGVPGLADVAIDARALAFACVVMLGAGVVSGLAPAFAIARGRVAVAEAGSRQTARGVARIQRGLIAVEVALSLVLLVGCGLLEHSLAQLRDVSTGFAPEGLTVVDVSGTRTFWRSDDRLREFFANAVDAMTQLPGVQAVAVTSAVPFGIGASSSPILIEGGDGRGRSTQQVSVTPGYFAVMRMSLLAGRTFTPDDAWSADPVVIVSRAAGRRDFGDDSPLGHRVRWQGKMRTIVGVVSDVRTDRLAGDLQPTIYIPVAQSGLAASLIVRSAGPIEPLAADIRARLRGLDSGAAVQSVQSMPALVARSYAEERFRAFLVTLFGAIAGLLAGVGVFAVTSRTVAMRLREAGIRVALGAPAVAVGRALARDIVTGVAVGLAAGGAGAVLLTRWLAPQLYGVSAWDVAAFAGAAGVLVTAVMTALVPPIRRAIAVDPVRVLRAE